MLVCRLRRWSNFDPTLSERLLIQILVSSITQLCQTNDSYDVVDLSIIQVKGGFCVYAVSDVDHITHVTCLTSG